MMARARHDFVLRVQSRTAVFFAALTLAASGAGPTEAVTNTVFVAFDVETTGFSPRADRLVELAAVKFRGTNILETQQWLIQPGMPIPASATRIHGITDAMVANAPGADVVLPLFNAFVKGTVLLAHQASFDVRFVAAEAARNGVPLPEAPVLDTLRLARAWFPKAKRHSLPELMRHVGRPFEHAHRAAADARALATLVMLGLARQPHEANLETLIKAAGGERRFGGAKQKSATARGENEVPAMPRTRER